MSAVGTRRRALVTGATRGIGRATAMALAGELGLDVNVWTVNEAPDIERAIGLGAGIVITDEPELAMQIRDRLV